MLDTTAASDQPRPRTTDARAHRPHPTGRPVALFRRVLPAVGLLLLAGLAGSLVGPVRAYAAPPDPRCLMPPPLPRPVPPHGVLSAPPHRIALPPGMPGMPAFPRLPEPPDPPPPPAPPRSLGAAAPHGNWPPGWPRIPGAGCSPPSRVNGGADRPGTEPAKAGTRLGRRDTQDRVRTSARHPTHRRATAVRPVSDAAGPATRAPNSAARAAPVVATPTAVEGFGPDDTYRRSLIYSGMFGLVIASIGMAMVGRRRRDW